MTDLGRRIANELPHPGALHIWGLGQAGFALRGAEALVLVDPWLSDPPAGGSPGDPTRVLRAAPSLLRSQDVVGADLVCVTHEHLDHLDGPTVAAIAARCPAARFVVPAPAADAIRAIGVAADRILAARADEPLEHIGVRPLAAAHDLDPGSFGGYRFWLMTRAATVRSATRSSCPAGASTTRATRSGIRGSSASCATCGPTWRSCRSTDATPSASASASSAT